MVGRCPQTHICWKTNPQYHQPRLQAAIGIVVLRLVSGRRIKGHWVAFLTLCARVGWVRCAVQGRVVERIRDKRLEFVSEIDLLRHTNNSGGSLWLSPQRKAYWYSVVR